MAKDKILKVGFDLDGVLLYNPARILRMPVTIFKHFFLPSREKKFIIPKNRLMKLIWKGAHFTSIFPSGGISEVESLVKANKIKAYIITGRYNFLDQNTQKWIKRLNKNNIFTEVFSNKYNQQPHLFKEKIIKELGLDAYIEDNYDIVKYLAKKTKADILWIYNILDLTITYPYKFSSLKKALLNLKHSL